MKFKLVGLFKYWYRNLRTEEDLYGVSSRVFLPALEALLVTGILGDTPHKVEVIDVKSLANMQ